MKQTHKLVTCGVCTTGSAAAGLPVVPAAALTAVAVMTTMWPDKLERPLGIRLFAHRGFTHNKWWAPLLVAAAAGVLLFAAVVYGPGLLEAVGIPAPPALDPAAAAGAGALLAAGVLTGYLSHLLADGCTIGGLKCGKDAHGRDRKVFLLPRVLRVRVGRNSRSERVFRFVFVVAWAGAMYLLVWPDLQHLAG